MELTKGMIMVYGGYAGLAITVITIIILLIRASKKNKFDFYDDVSETNESSNPVNSFTSALVPTASNYNNGVESTVVLDMDSTEIMYKEAVNADSDKTVLLENNIEETEILD